MVEPLQSSSIEYLARVKGLKSIVESAAIPQTDIELGAGALAAFGEFMSAEDRQAFADDLAAYQREREARL